MKVFRGQAKNLRKNIKQNNIKPLLIVFGVLVTITLTYKASNGVMGVGNTAFKEGMPKKKAARICTRSVGKRKFNERKWDKCMSDHGYD